jgi:hypothetical protein
VLTVKPVNILVKFPVPVPALVFELAVVGLAVIAQHTPRAVIDAPPSELILPPLSAEV